MTMQNTRAVVETEHGMSEKFSINTGLRQGDAVSTLMFNLVLEGIIRKLDTVGNISRGQEMRAIIRCRISCLLGCYPKI